LFQDALTRTGKDAFTEYIEFARRMSNLSVYNAMLVRVQRPGAAAVATEKKWNSIQRNVKPGAIPIVILRPFGPVSFLYEVADTDGFPLPGEHANPFAAHGELSEVEWARMLKHHREKNFIRTEERNFGSLLAGNARNVQAVPSLVPELATTEWLIQVNQNPRQPRLRPRPRVDRPARSRTARPCTCAPSVVPKTTTLIYLPLERQPFTPATFPWPTVAEARNHAASQLLLDALQLKLRSGAGPFRSFGNIAVEPRAYQLVPLLMALKQPSCAC
jgi:hypothetical protein